MKTRILMAFNFIWLMIPVNILFAQSEDIKPLIAKKIKDGIYIHKSGNANITISSGDDGLLIIDTGTKDRAGRSDSLIRKGFLNPVKFIINTHSHFDHVQGNDVFAKEGAIIISSSKTRENMMKEWKVPDIPGTKFPVIPPFEKEYLPQVCFDDSLIIHFNDETIKLIHYPGGHSSGDIVVFFEKANVVHMGDLFLTDAFPPVTDINRYIEVLDVISSMCTENTIIIPGHGRISNTNDLISYREMISEGAERILTLKSQGKSYEEILEANPIASLLHVKSWIPESLFIYCIYFKPKI